MTARRGSVLEPGTRVFFKRQAWQRLCSYWCGRWDNVELREVLSRTDRPKYYVERAVLGGLFCQLERLDFLWYAGLFTLASPGGRRRQLSLTLRGLGPRELVFPTSFVERLERVTLLRAWPDYQLSTEQMASAIPLPWGTPRTAPEAWGEYWARRLVAARPAGPYWLCDPEYWSKEEREIAAQLRQRGGTLAASGGCWGVPFAVESMVHAVAPPLFSWLSRPTVDPLPTVCLTGRALGTPLGEQRLCVPLREVRWADLPGYRQRYLT